jgi:hypothetical protein
VHPNLLNKNFKTKSAAQTLSLFQFIFSPKFFSDPNSLQQASWPSSLSDPAASPDPRTLSRGPHDPAANTAFPFLQHSSVVAILRAAACHHAKPRRRLLSLKMHLGSRVSFGGLMSNN